MHRIISWYNQNRRRIWIVIISIIVIAAISYRLLLNLNNSETNESNEIANIDSNTFNSITITSQNSVLSEEKITTSQEEISTIDNFVQYCNLGKIEEAYNLVSDECKEELYPRITIFQEKYYNPVFKNGNRNVVIENWADNIFRVNYNEDVLSTGKYSAENSLQDYITIVTSNDGTNNLNIRKYIGRSNIDKTNENNEGIQIRVLKSDSYIDYEYYTFEITNNTEKTISLGNIKDLEATYLIDEEDLTYTAYMNELQQDDLNIEAGQTKKIRIKYYNQYSSEREIKQLEFSKVILDFELYKTNTNSFNNYTTIIIDL